MLKVKVVTYFIVVVISLFTFSCAQIVPLTGGEKDQEPPKVVVETPINAGLNFNTELIEIEFDENIQLNNPLKEIIISPKLNQPPEFSVKGKKLIIRFKEKPAANTTFTLQFQNAIRDVHEGNELKNYLYSFTTGMSADTCRLLAKLTDALSGVPLKGIVFALYKDTIPSFIYTNTPDYYTTSNERGEVDLKNIKKGMYRVIAFNDENSNLFYDKGELFAYSKEIIDLNDTLSLQLSLFKELPTSLYVKRNELLSPGKQFVLLNKPAGTVKKISSSINLESNPSDLSYFFSSERDSIILYTKGHLNDSVKFTLITENGDTLNLAYALVTQEAVTKILSKKRYPLELNTSFKSGTQAYFMPVWIQASREIKTLYKDSLYLLEDGIPVSNTRFECEYKKPDSVLINYPFKSDHRYEVFIAKGWINDYFNQSNDSIRFNFKLNSEEDYGTALIHMVLPERGNYVLQLLDPTSKIKFNRSFECYSANEEVSILADHLLPGIFKIRIIKDDDKNSRYTSGNYDAKRVSEQVWNTDQTLKIIEAFETELKLNIK